MELLGLTIDHKLKFVPHLEKLCKTARFKLHALCRIRKFLTFEQAKLLANSFINTQLSMYLWFGCLQAKTSIHQKHVIHLAIKIYKSLANLNPEFMWPFIKNKYITYNLRNASICILPPARSCHYGINSIQFWGSLLWNNLPISLNESGFVKEFKQKLNPVQKIHCSCVACRRF